jgi:aspartate/methionine/tyrosine aminotransferase
MNLIYKRRRVLTEQLAEKLGCQVYKEGVGLFVWAKLPSGIASAEAFINDILYQKHLFITPGTILVVMVKVIFGLHCASRGKKYKRRLIDFLP